jgi:hypothetical protein
VFACSTERGETCAVRQSVVVRVRRQRSGCLLWRCRVAATAACAHSPRLRTPRCSRARWRKTPGALAPDALQPAASCPSDRVGRSVRFLRAGSEHVGWSAVMCDVRLSSLSSHRRAAAAAPDVGADAGVSRTFAPRSLPPPHPISASRSASRTAPHRTAGRTACCTHSLLFGSQRGHTDHHVRAPSRVRPKRPPTAEAECSFASRRFKSVQLARLRLRQPGSAGRRRSSSAEMRMRGAPMQSCVDPSCAKRHCSEASEH